MRYQSALVLGTLAVGQAAASNQRHAKFHRRSEVKRGMADVDWSKVSYDLSGVDWSKVDYSGGAASSPAPAPAPVAAPAPTEAAPAPAPVAPAPVAPAPVSSAAPAPPAQSPASDPIGNVIGDIFDGLSDLVASLGAKIGENSKTNNGKVWLGDGSDYAATFTNAGSSPAVVYCWSKSGMWINANVPDLSFKLKAGQSQKISIAKGYSGGCGAAYADSNLFMGLLNESILEFTANSGADGCFDVSREINMNGIVMGVKGTKCSSGKVDGAQSCTFVCTGGASRCGAGGGDYAIDLGAATEGLCMVGKDPFTGDASGGCQMGNGEHMEVTFSDSRAW